LPNSAQNSPNPHNGNEWHGQANVNSNSSSGNAMNSSSSSNDVVSFNQIPWERLDFVDTKDIDEKKLDPKILKVQNMALGRQLNVNKKAISLLEDQLSKFEKKHIETLTQLQTLNSSWNSLDKELSILIEKFNPSGGNFPKPNFDTDNDSNSEFQERQDFTKKLLETILSQISTVLSAQIQQLPNADSDYRDRFEKFQKSVDELQMENRELRLQLSHEQNVRTKLETKTENIQERLEDSQYELEKANLAIERLRHSNEKPADNNSSTSGDNPTSIVQTNGISSDNFDEMTLRLKQEKAELQTMCEGRLLEIVELRAQKVKLENELQRTKLELSNISEETICNSTAYRMLSSKCEFFHAERDSYRDRVDNLSKEMDELKEKKKGFKRIF